MESLLIGNSFPMSLITREVIIKPKTIDDLHRKIETAKEIYSFWGHDNTVQIASKICGTNLKNRGDGSMRPAVTTTPDGLPSLGGLVFRECWILTPEYIKTFRPSIGEEVDVEMIKNWRVLRIQWV